MAREPDPPTTHAAGTLRQAAYMAAVGLSNAGTAIALIAATRITTVAGGAYGATYTAIYLSVGSLVGVLAAHSASRWAARTSPAIAYEKSLIAYVGVWWAVSAAILFGLDAFAVVLIGAVPLGVLVAVRAVVSPVIANAYLGGPTMSKSYSRMSAIRGLSWIVGSLTGGYLLGDVAPEVGLILGAALAVPLILVLRYVPRISEPLAARAPRGEWRALMHEVNANRILRLALAMTVALAIFTIPLVNLIVPIAYTLRTAPLLPGVGIVMAAFGVGEMLTPIVVRFLARQRSELGASAWCGIGAALSLFAFAVVSDATSYRIELGAWFCVGVAYGAMRYSSRALFVSAAAASTGHENATRIVAALVSAAMLVSPVGLLAWGLLIDRASPEAAVTFGAAGTALVSIVVLVRTRHEIETAQ